MFNIKGGPGRPADLPTGLPAAVVMIPQLLGRRPFRSPDDRRAMAGKGAFVYYGIGLRALPPGLSPRRPGRRDGGRRGAPGRRLETSRVRAVGTASLATDLPGRPPLPAAEPDPAHGPPSADHQTLLTTDIPSAVAGQAREPSNGESRPALSTNDRVSSREWRKMVKSYEDWPVVEVTASESRPATSTGGYDETLLRWCLDAAIVELEANLPVDDTAPVARRFTAARATLGPEADPSQPARTEPVSDL